MSKSPYPGFSPSYQIVDKIGGYSRTCLVLEFLSTGDLTPVQIAMIQEQLEGTAERLRKQLVASVEAVQVVTPDRFDPILKQGLRLPRP